MGWTRTVPHSNTPPLCPPPLLRSIHTHIPCAHNDTNGVLDSPSCSPSPPFFPPAAPPPPPPTRTHTHTHTSRMMSQRQRGTRYEVPPSHARAPRHRLPCTSSASSNPPDTPPLGPYLPKQAPPATLWRCFSGRTRCRRFADIWRPTFDEISGSVGGGQGAGGGECKGGRGGGGPVKGMGRTGTGDGHGELSHQISRCNNKRSSVICHWRLSLQ